MHDIRLLNYDHVYLLYGGHDFTCRVNNNGYGYVDSDHQIYGSLYIFILLLVCFPNIISLIPNDRIETQWPWQKRWKHLSGAHLERAYDFEHKRIQRIDRLKFCNHKLYTIMLALYNTPPRPDDMRPSERYKKDKEREQKTWGDRPYFSIEDRDKSIRYWEWQLERITGLGIHGQKEKYNTDLPIYEHGDESLDVIKYMDLERLIQGQTTHLNEVEAWSTRLPRRQFSYQVLGYGKTTWEFDEYREDMKQRIIETDEEEEEPNEWIDDFQEVDGSGIWQDDFRHRKGIDEKFAHGIRMGYIDLPPTTLQELLWWPERIIIPSQIPKRITEDGWTRSWIWIKPGVKWIKPGVKAEGKDYCTSMMLPEERHVWKPHWPLDTKRPRVTRWLRQQRWWCTQYRVFVDYYIPKAGKDYRLTPMPFIDWEEAEKEGTHTWPYTKGLFHYIEHEKQQ